MLAENAVTQYGDFISIERDELAVQSKNFTYDDWKIHEQRIVELATMLIAANRFVEEAIRNSPLKFAYSADFKTLSA